METWIPPPLLFPFLKIESSSLLQEESVSEYNTIFLERESRKREMCCSVAVETE